ncbi:MAG: hypothetical protein Q8R70_12185, partial [Methanoregula sp.]|nr:hypothetical protein [Methanoregula sp.]
MTGMEKSLMKRYGRIFAGILIITLLLVSPAAAEICWGKICTASPFRDSGLCAICCSGHGTCIGFNNCKCNSGWTGQECEIPTFCGNCSNLCNTIGKGICSPVNGSKGSCFCANGYTGICCTESAVVLPLVKGILDPTWYVFGDVPAGTPATMFQPVRYSHFKSSGSMTIQSIAIGGTNTGDFALGAGTCTAGGNVA